MTGAAVSPGDGFIPHLRGEFRFIGLSGQETDPRSKGHSRTMRSKQQCGRFLLHGLVDDAFMAQHNSLKTKMYKVSEWRV